MLIFYITFNLSSADFFKSNVIPPECETVWLHIRPYVLDPGCLQILSANDNSLQNDISLHTRVQKVLSEGIQLQL